MVILEPELNKHIWERVRKNTLNNLGCQGEETIRTEIKNTLDEAILRTRKTVRPKGIYHLLSVLKTSGDGIYTDAGTIQSVKFSHLADRCRGDRKILFVIATLGANLDGIYRSSESLFHQFLFDALWSELIVAVADEVDAKWKREVEGAGLRYSSRFSPGYCDWSLEGQSIIFKALDAAQIGVRLTSHFAMIPSKSISAIVLLAKEVPFTIPCVFCEKKDCAARRSVSSL